MKCTRCNEDKSLTVDFFVPRPQTVAAAFGVSPAAVHAIRNGTAWAHITGSIV